MMKNIYFAVLGFAIVCSNSLAWGDQANANRINELKGEILYIAKFNTDNTETFPFVRAQLEPLIQELETLSNISFEDEKKLKIGAWRQLWTDDADDLRGNNAFQTVDRSKTFQVVFNDNIFYNISEIKTPFGIFTGVLQGKYEAIDPKFVLEFTDLKIKLGGIENTSIFNFAKAVKQNKIGGIFSLPGNQKYPNGPIGAKGDVDSIYIDSTLRIDRGQNFADGIQDLFILERANIQ